ncbi:hypothetical protein DMH17_03720 [Raoultella planticola]|nr:hypothetical protein [Raoultella planticola]
MRAIPPSPIWLTHGDFGLGTFNELDGELIAFSSEFTSCAPTGSARKAHWGTKDAVRGDDWFRPQHRVSFDHPVNRQQLHEIIDRQIPPTICSAPCISTATFVTPIPDRPRQTPYRAMTDVLDDQPVFRFNQRKGILVGFRTPQHMQGINVAGYHEHFITDDRQAAAICWITSSIAAC